MLGKFQKSNQRIEIQASAKSIRNSMLYPEKLSQWLWVGKLSPGLPEKLSAGLTFTTQIGFVNIENEVVIATENCLRLLLSQGIDGYQEWFWGEGWIQSRLEGISFLPLNLAQTICLYSLREFLKNTNSPMDN